MTATPIVSGFSGVLPIQQLRMLISENVIAAAQPITAQQLQPNSLDLRVGPTAYRVRYSFLSVNATVESLLQELTLDALDLTKPDGALLETNKVYLVPLLEQLKLPDSLVGTTNPKSSIGRIDMLVRLLGDRASMFDVVPAGYRGPLYLEIVPRAFPIRLRQGDTLTQLRLSTVGQTSAAHQLTDDELRNEIAQHQLILGDDGKPIDVHKLHLDDGVFLSVYLGDEHETTGYVARRSTPAVDLRRTDHLAATYWDKVSASQTQHDRLVLQPHEFYIFSSRERVVVPPHLCAEMVPYDAKSGELRTHYAGFFDSGFGLGTGGARVVLEVRNLDVPFLLQDSQRLFRLRYFRNAAKPEVLYGSGLKSNYQGQGLKLSKHFQAHTL